LVDTERGASSSITEFETAETPVSGRSFKDLALLVPGVVAQNDRQEFGCAGYVTGSIFPAYGAYVVTSGPRKADTVAFKCTYRDYDPCPTDVCFGPINASGRFALSRIPKDWIKNSPSEIENGVDQRWQVKILDRCRNGGFELTTTQTVGTDGSLEDPVLLDTQTGLQFPGPSRRRWTLDQYADVGFKLESWCGLP
jgi:hypothetical protein